MQKLFLNFVKGVLLTATWVFSLCLSAQNITVTGINPVNIGETTFDPNTYINATLNVPTNSKNNYQVHPTNA